MNEEWRYLPEDPDRWETWSLPMKPQVKILRVFKNPSEHREWYIWGNVAGSVDSPEGYYVEIGGSGKADVILPLEMPIEDVKATAIAIARMS